MKFFQERKRKKQLSELKSRRRAEDDLLSPALRSRFDNVISELQNAPAEQLDEAIKKAQKEYSALPLPKRGKLYSFLDLIAVVGLVAFGLRGLFFQPFRIPTGSMQPTLFGVHYQQADGNANPGFRKLGGIVHSLVFGSVSVDLDHTGEAGYVDPLVNPTAGTFFDYTEFSIGRNRYRLPGNLHQLEDYSNIGSGVEFKRGDVISRGHFSLGDHLFVERVSMYLSPPKRGDVIVFNTEGLFVEGIPLEKTGGYYYIKRLAALPGDTVKITGNQLYVRPAGEKIFRKIQEIEPRFEKVYSNKGGYHGHISDMGDRDFARGEEYTIPEDHYLMLGDNSSFSMDSRYFGAVPRKNLIGRAWLVFYPFSRRIGWVDRQEPLDEPTGAKGFSSYAPMSHQ